MIQFQPRSPGFWHMRRCAPTSEPRPRLKPPPCRLELLGRFHVPNFHLASRGTWTMNGFRACSSNCHRACRMLRAGENKSCQELGGAHNKVMMLACKGLVKAELLHGGPALLGAGSSRLRAACSEAAEEHLGGAAPYKSHSVARWDWLTPQKPATIMFALFGFEG